MKIIAYIFSSIFFIEGVLLSMGYSIYGARMTIEPTTRSIITSFVFSFLCILFTRYIKKEKYSKCPECKKTYDYSKLDNGICPICNIKTIDMEKYYDN